MIRRPLATGAAAFVVGSLGGLTYGCHRAAALAAILPLAAARLLPAGRRLRPWLAMAIATLLGWTLAAGHHNHLREGRLYLERLAATGRQARISGRVVGSVAQRPAGHDEIRCSFILTDLRVHRPPGSSPIAVRRHPYALPTETINVYWYGPAAAARLPSTGDTWLMQGRLRRRAAAPGQYPIQYTLVTRRADSSPSDRAHSRWRQWLENHRRAAAAALAVGVDPASDETALVHAMLLGYRRDLPRPLARAFRHSGTIHIFAISGLHVMVIATIFTLAASLLGIPRRFWILPLAPALALYIIATGGQPSAMRAGLMASLYLLAPLLGRRPDPLTILGIAAATLVLANPLQLYNLGFILSFSMVLGLVILVGPFIRATRHVFRIAPLTARLDLARPHTAPRASSPRLRLFSAFLTMLGWIADLIAVSLAAWLTSLPLTSHFFGFIPVYSPLANLFVVPMSSVLISLASLSLAAAGIAPALSQLCNQIVALAARSMKLVSAGVADLPGAAVTYRMSLPAMLAWCLTLWGAVLLAERIASRRRRASAAWMIEEI